ncbi:PepSY-associated TM helix domain-containing protein [Novosphingobium sp. JCM 18896]|uniref:PepSY-associated TM helix domain-containing protein n=1 Tax=Novosphingobium sp. JCM 18896 TaxID=2989731 RepID=UPI0022230D29|nr:PepSY-associated TM helix domain-containing protein [Novosphingobium sp. JCM 18896]MCW1427810.1 PepSY domain-containing protein [Novosphingobium sp. JCM 18896]
MATRSLPARPLSSRKTSRIWWHVHQWVGLKLALFTSFVFLTGTLAVLSSEIDWLLQPSLRVAPAGVGGEPDWEKIVASAARYPGIQRIQLVETPTASAFAVKVTVIWKDRHYGFLHVHPTTGEVQGTGPWVGAQRILRNMHRHLNMPGWIGIPIVTAVSFLLMISLVTSFVVYKKWWRGFLKAPRRRGARTWWGDFHRLAGVWSLWFVALIALTGFWYFVEKLGADAPVPSLSKVAPYPGGPTTIGRRFAASLAAARAADPDLRLETIRFPTETSGAFVFGGQKSALLVRPRANAVWVEAANAEALAVYHAEDLNLNQRISEMADPLHFGTFGGYWTKLPWFLFGALLTALSVSGVAIYALRLSRPANGVEPEQGAWRLAWFGMGAWRWLALALVAAAFLLIPALLLEVA